MGLTDLSFWLVLAITVLTASSITPRPPAWHQSAAKAPVAHSADDAGTSDVVRSRLRPIWKTHNDPNTEGDYEEYNDDEVDDDDDDESGEVTGDSTSPIVDGTSPAEEAAKKQFLRPAVDEPVPPPTPKFMLELYEKFGKDRHAHPIANIVRSFVTQESATSRQRRATQHVSVHHVTFNLTSLQPHEDVYLAELRLYCELHGHPAGIPTFIVYVYERISDEEFGGTRLVAFRRIGRYDSGWETFPLTDAVYRWMKTGEVGKRFEIHVVQYRANMAAYSDVSMSIVTSLDDPDQPILVVFSDDRDQEALHTRERQDLIEHELSSVNNHPSAAPTPVNNRQSGRIAKRDTHNVDEYTEASSFSTQSLADQYRNVYNLSVDATEELRQSLRGMKPLHANVSESELLQPSRLKRARGNGRRRRNPCHRKSMIVNFADIYWDKWIIEPKSYQAYECAGRCYFPITDDLNPTKHAIIQTQLHYQRTKSSSGRTPGSACCVPTRLGAISLLYIEHGSITFKYQYDGMVVHTCGCR